MNKNSYLIALSESERSDFGRIDFLDQSPEQRVFSAVWALESEVNNGGFSQYFGSANGETANFAPAALKTIGADACAEIVSRAVRIVAPSGMLPFEQVMRAELVESLSDELASQLDLLDAEFYAYPDNLTELLYAYVSAHPATFGIVAAGT